MDITNVSATRQGGGYKQVGQYQHPGIHDHHETHTDVIRNGRVVAHSLTEEGTIVQPPPVPVYKTVLPYTDLKVERVRVPITVHHHVSILQDRVEDHVTHHEEPYVIPGEKRIVHEEETRYRDRIVREAYQAPITHVYQEPDRTAVRHYDTVEHVHSTVAVPGIATHVIQ